MFEQCEYSTTTRNISRQYSRWWPETPRVIKVNQRKNFLSQSGPGRGAVVAPLEDFALVGLTWKPPPTYWVGYHYHYHLAIIARMMSAVSILTRLVFQILASRLTKSARIYYQITTHSSQVRPQPGLLDTFSLTTGAGRAPGNRLAPPRVRNHHQSCAGHQGGVRPGSVMYSQITIN